MLLRTVTRGPDIMTQWTPRVYIDNIAAPDGDDDHELSDYTLIYMEDTIQAQLLTDERNYSREFDAMRDYA